MSASLIDACFTVGELIALLELAKRSAIKAQDFQCASLFRDAQQRLRKLNPEDLLVEHPEAKKGLEQLPVRYAV